MIRTRTLSALRTNIPEIVPIAKQYQQQQPAFQTYQNRETLITPRNQYDTTHYDNILTNNQQRYSSYSHNTAKTEKPSMKLNVINNPFIVPVNKVANNANNNLTNERFNSFGKQKQKKMLQKEKMQNLIEEINSLKKELNEYNFVNQQLRFALEDKSKMIAFQQTKIKEFESSKSYQMFISQNNETIRLLSQENNQLKMELRELDNQVMKVVSEKRKEIELICEKKYEQEIQYCYEKKVILNAQQTQIKFLQEQISQLEIKLSLQENLNNQNCKQTCEYKLKDPSSKFVKILDNYVMQTSNEIKFLVVESNKVINKNWLIKQLYQLLDYLNTFKEEIVLEFYQNETDLRHSDQLANEINQFSLVQTMFFGNQKQQLFKTLQQSIQLLRITFQDFQIENNNFLLFFTKQFTSSFQTEISTQIQSKLAQLQRAFTKKVTQMSKELEEQKSYKLRNVQLVEENSKLDKLTTFLEQQLQKVKGNLEKAKENQQSQIKDISS